MKTVLIVLVIALFAGGVFLQEIGCWGRRESASSAAKAEGGGGRVTHSSSSLLPTLSGLIQERRKDFEKIVFAPISVANSNAVEAVEPSPASSSNGLHELLFRNHSYVEAEGAVVMLIEPEKAASERRQKFVVRLASGNMILVRHDTDTAAAIEDLKLGDTVRFAGEYTFGQNGDEISNTFADPTGAHKSGWIRHNGRTYQ